MSQIPGDLKYITTHQWARLEAGGVASVGITDFAQSQLGDIVFVELPELEVRVNQDEEAGVVESVKSASDVYSPVSGEVIAVNERLVDAPELINADPYGDGWLFRVKLDDVDELEDLLSAEEYEEAVAAEE